MWRYARNAFVSNIVVLACSCLFFKLNLDVLFELDLLLHYYVIRSKLHPAERRRGVGGGMRGGGEEANDQTVIGY